MAGPFKNLSVPPGGFPVILADPPWPWKTRGCNGHKKSPERHYKTMSIEDIAALPVGDVAADNAVLFLWVTWPMMFHTFKKRIPGGNFSPDAGQTIYRLPDKSVRINVINGILNSWGFEYSGLAWEWNKVGDSGKRAFGGGYITRKNFEPCIVARRGRLPPRKSRSVQDIIVAPRREHSRKPDQQYGNIQKLFDGPYLELFAVDNLGECQRPNWTRWNPVPHRRKHNHVVF